MSEKTDTWMPLYIGDYLADTSHLSTLEHGAYLLLLMAYWRKKGPLPDDDIKLARMAGLSLKQWKAIRQNVVELFRTGDGQLVSTRAQRELDNARVKSEKARANALERYKTDAADAEPTQSERTATDLLAGVPPRASPSPSPVPTEHKSNTRSKTRRTSERNPDFAEWYAVFPLKKDPSSAEVAYLAARKKVSKECLLRAAEAYAADNADTEPQYIRHPTTWLHKRTWENYPDADLSAQPALTLAVDNTPKRYDPFEEDYERWRGKIKFFVDRGYWNCNDGAEPGKPWCEVPQHILDEFPQFAKPAVAS